MYQQNRMLGEGEYAKVYAAVDLRGNFALKSGSNKVAVKVINLDALDGDEISQIEREIIIHRKMNHPNIIAIRSVYVHDNRLYLIEDEAFGGDLFDLIANHNPSCNREDDIVALKLLKTLLGVVKYMHESGVAHRDLKPENILLRDARDVTSMLVGDFGHCALMEGHETHDWSSIPAGRTTANNSICVSKEADHMEVNTMRTQVGSPEYMAPELATAQYPNLSAKKKRGLQAEEDPKLQALIDEWSVGVIAFLFLTGQFPFGDENRGNAISLARSIVNDKLHWPEGEGEFDNPEIKKIVEGLLEKDFHKRTSAEAALKMKIFKDIDITSEKQYVDDYTINSPANGKAPEVTSPRKRANTVGTETREKQSKSVLHVGVGNWDAAELSSSPPKSGAGLEDVDVCLDRAGKPLPTAGNSALVKASHSSSFKLPSRPLRLSIPSS